MSTLTLYGSNGVSSVGLKVNSTKSIVFIAIGVALSVLAVNFINDDKRCY